MKKTKAAIISQGSGSSKMTLEAMKKYFDEVEDIDITKVEINLGSKDSSVLYMGKPIGKYDCIYAKGSFRYAPLLRSISSHISQFAFTPIIPSAFTIGHDKLLTHQQFQVEGVPMPLTYIAATADAARRILEKVNYPIILKFPQGTQGKGVMFAESYASATSLLDALTALNQPFIIQEYIETEGSDIRAFVIGDKVIASMKRKATNGEKRSNIHQGGVGEPCELDNYTKKIAIDASKAIGAEICGVDILEGASGPKVIEINLSPGLRGITKATKVDVADKIAKFLFDKTKKILEKEHIKSSKKIMEEEGLIDSAGAKEIISALDFRGNRILLPEIVTQITSFNDKNEMNIKVEKGKLEIKKF